MERKLLKLFKMKNNPNPVKSLSSTKKLNNNFQPQMFFILILVSFFSFTATAQNDELDKSNIGQSSVDMSNFNLAPGMVFSPKKVNLIDYSFMLEQIPTVEPKKFMNDDFLKIIPKEKLDYWKSSEPQVYQYYATAKNFYDNLSNKVKSVLSVDVLWHIYFYDVKLKNQLQSIK
ncbi:MAG: hypothetical protein V4548_11355 [Bacteroidota bacterium]